MKIIFTLLRKLLSMVIRRSSKPLPTATEKLPQLSEESKADYENKSMFPLKERKLIRGFQAHITAGLGGAADYVADHIPLYAPFDGVIQTYFEVGGGNWLRLTRSNGDKL